MKKQDLLWVLILALISLIFVVPTTRIGYEQLNQNYPYLLGFIKTSILAFMGELLVSRIKHQRYFYGSGHFLKWFVWGLLGMIFVLVFKIFASGVVGAQSASLLPQISSGLMGSLLTAFLISLLMNLSFAPTFMILHRITDGYIYLSEGKLNKLSKVKLKDVISGIDWQFFFHTVVLKSIPLFWIPAHTITFLLPENYRVLMAAYLSIALGIIMSLRKPTKREVSQS